MFIPRRNPIQHAIFDMFRPGGGGGGNTTQNPAPQQNQQQQDNPGNMNQNTQTNKNPNDPSQQQNQDLSTQQNQDPNKKDNKSPLADFATLWDTAPAPKEGEPAQTDWNDHNSIVPELNVDPKKLMEGAKRIDFSKVLDPAKVKLALSGDGAAFGEIINTVAQAVFANSALSTTKIAKAVMSQMAEKLYSGALPHHFRKHAIDTQINTDLPILSNPAVAPMFESFKEQLRVKYPKSSAQEISGMAKRMVTEFAEAIQGPGNKDKPGTNTNSKGDADFDWLEFATPKQK